MSEKPHILVTGGTGYIGSHTSVELLLAGCRVTIVDNLAESDIGVLDGIGKLAGQHPGFVPLDLRDKAALDRLFSAHHFAAVIHFAGYKAVGDSVTRPLWYYDNNVVGSANVLGAMIEHGVKRIVFSSSCTVYGNPDEVPVHENSPLLPANPYGRTKLTVELMLRDLCAADPEFTAVALRYFNPVGAHESGLLGESPKGIPNNLMPYICQTAAGIRKKLSIFGGDYPTPDGTCIRDYLHVVDLAEAHVRALAVPSSKFRAQGYEEESQANGQGSTEHPAPSTQKSGTPEPGTRNPEPNKFVAVNLGTGQGYSVLEMVETFKRMNGVDVPYEIVGRRPGDAACCYCIPALAEKLLGWKANRNLEAMCRDAWRWQKKGVPALAAFPGGITRG